MTGKARRRPRFTVARKASFGYAVLLTLLFLTSGVALLSLSRLNAINESIIRTDIPVVNASDRLIEELLAEEHYARRSVILKTPAIYGIFRDKGKEFEAIMSEIRVATAREGVPLAEIERIHEEYRRMLTLWVESGGGGDPPGGVSDAALRRQQERLVSMIKGMADRARKSHHDKMERIGRIGAMAFRVAAVFCGIGLLIALLAAVLITRSISGTIGKLKLAAGRIVQGDFDNIPQITRRDELGAVAVAFIGMAKRLRHLEDVQRKARIGEARQAVVAGAAGTESEERAVETIAAEEVPVVSSSDVRQMTGLPAGRAVFEGLRRRIQEKRPFAYCVIRIEHLKAYNDRYDWGKGDTMVQAAAGIIEDAVADAGGEDDLVGHKLGAQFVVLTTPDRSEKICTGIIKDFEEGIPFFYDPEDREQGYIMGKAPGGASAVFPLACLSIAVITSESPDARTADHVQVAAGRLLEWARAQGGNLHVVNEPT